VNELPDLNNKMKYPIETDSEGMAMVVDEDSAGQKAIPIVFVAKESDGKFRHSNNPDVTKPINNKMKTDIEEDTRGKKEVVDEDVNGVKAIPFTLVKKDENGNFVYTKFAESADLSNYYTKSEADSKFIDASELENSLGNYYTKTEVDSKVSSKADSEDVYTKSEVDTKLSSKADTSNVYTKTEVDSIVSNKADASSVYTKTEVDSLVSAKADASSVYTKTEVDSKLAAKLSASQAEAQADSSAEDVAGLVADFNTLLAKLRAAGIMAE
jgi:hypothetical protein